MIGFKSCVMLPQGITSYHQTAPKKNRLLNGSPNRTLTQSQRMAGSTGRTAALHCSGECRFWVVYEGASKRSRCRYCAALHGRFKPFLTDAAQSAKKETGHAMKVAGQDPETRDTQQEWSPCL